MSATPAGTSPGDRTYIRAGGGADINPRRLVGILVWICVALLVAFAVYFAVSANQRSSQLSLLHQHGIPVTATVTGCTAVGSGIGMGVEYYQCTGSYALGGQAFNEVIRGSRNQMDNGQRLAAIAVPGHPSLLSTVSAARARKSSTGENTAAVVLGATAVGIVGGQLRALRRRRRRAAAT
jgi:hypothetical protein